MAELLLHLVIPIIVLLALKPNLDKKLVFALAILTIAPDFDYVVGHRSLFHNVFFVAAFSFIIFLLFKYVINENRIAKRAENSNAFYLSLYYLFFHLFLDIGSPGIPFFYPFLDRLFSFNVLLFINKRTNEITSMSSFSSQPLAELSRISSSPFLTTLGVLLFAVVILFLIVKYINKE